MAACLGSLQPPVSFLAVRFVLPIETAQCSRATYDCNVAPNLCGDSLSSKRAGLMSWALVNKSLQC
jgi:hypothetical protein